MTKIREATFTYTNAAPQYPGFNRGYWADMEEMVKNHIETNCGAENAFFITGVAPGQNNRYLWRKSSAENRVRLCL